jgi:signal peptidase II
MSETTSESPTSSLARDRVFWTLLVLIAVVDVFTKRWAENALGLHTPEEVVGHWLRWTLTYNTGAAMNLSLGAASRVVFSAVAIGMIIYLFRLYRQTHPAARAAPAALAMISAGAFGNLLDRLRHEKGVVDFIDVGTANWRFWTFNVADMGVTMGALLLALLLLREEETDTETVPAVIQTPHETSSQ